MIRHRLESLEHSKQHRHMMNIFSSSCLSALVLTAALAAQSLSPANTQNAPKSVLDGFQVRAASMQDLNLPVQGAPGFEVTVRIAGQDRKLILRAREMRHFLS